MCLLFTAIIRLVLFDNVEYNDPALRDFPQYHTSPNSYRLIQNVSFLFYAEFTLELIPIGAFLKFSTYDVKQILLHNKMALNIY